MKYVVINGKKCCLEMIQYSRDDNKVPIPISKDDVNTLFSMSRLEVSADSVNKGIMRMEKQALQHIYSTNLMTDEVANHFVEQMNSYFGPGNLVQSVKSPVEAPVIEESNSNSTFTNQLKYTISYYNKDNDIYETVCI
eukprot:CFRG5192T1